MSSISGLQKTSFAKNKDLYVGAGLIIDTLAPRGSTRDVDTIINYRQEIFNENSSPLGSTINTKLPTEGHLVDIIYKMTWADTATQPHYAYHHVYALLNSRLKHGGTEIYDFEPSQVWNALIPTLNSEQQTEMLALAGGVGSGSQTGATFAMPMIQPFSHFWHQTEPLNLTIGRNSTFTLDLKFRTRAETVFTGGTLGDVTNLTVICMMVESADEIVKQKHIKENKPIHSFSYFTKNSGTIATATKTAVKISPSGLTKHISIIGHLNASSIGMYYANKYMDELEINADGLKDIKYESSQEARIWSLIEGFKPNATLGFVHQYAPNTPFNNMKAGHYTGGLNITSINTFNLNITHSLGADANFDVIAFLYALYAYDSYGNLSRIN